jgi:hypothetical protein
MCLRRVVEAAESFDHEVSWNITDAGRVTLDAPIWRIRYGPDTVTPPPAACASRLPMSLPTRQ